MYKFLNFKKLFIREVKNLDPFTETLESKGESFEQFEIQVNTYINAYKKETPLIINIFNKKWNIEEILVFIKQRILHFISSQSESFDESQNEKYIDLINNNELDKNQDKKSIETIYYIVSQIQKIIGDRTINENIRSIKIIEFEIKIFQERFNQMEILLKKQHFFENKGNITTKDDANEGLENIEWLKTNKNRLGNIIINLQKILSHNKVLGEIESQIHEIEEGTATKELINTINIGRETNDELLDKIKLLKISTSKQRIETKENQSLKVLAPLKIIIKQNIENIEIENIILKGKKFFETTISKPGLKDNMNLEDSTLDDIMINIKTYCTSMLHNGIQISSRHYKLIKFTDKYYKVSIYNQTKAIFNFTKLNHGKEMIEMETIQPIHEDLEGITTLQTIEEIGINKVLNIIETHAHEENLDEIYNILSSK